MSDVEILFHEYPISPFAEKVRRVFAHKGMSYRSVEQPMWMPKPELTPLTGGFRRIPVMQIGADIYCDTALISRKLEELQPSPTIYPNPVAAEATAAWADKQLFQVCVPLVFGALAEMLPPELLADRQKMRPEMTAENLEAAAPNCRNAFRAATTRLDETFANTNFVLGDAFSVADAAIYHCLWFASNAPEPAEALKTFPNLSAWMQRLAAMGVGEPTPMPASEAMAVAKSAVPATKEQADAGDPNGLAPGARVGICSDDLLSDVFEGEVLALDAQEVVIRREDPEVGEIAIHFPRAGYYILPA
jgi:glutathione S-transferase